MYTVKEETHSLPGLSRFNLVQPWCVIAMTFRRPCCSVVQAVCSMHCPCSNPATSLCLQPQNRSWHPKQALQEGARNLSTQCRSHKIKICGGDGYNIQLIHSFQQYEHNLRQQTLPHLFGASTAHAGMADAMYARFWSSLTCFLEDRSCVYRVR